MTSTSDTSDEPVDPERHPLDEPRTPIAAAEPVVPVRQSRGLGVNRHLGSVVLSCLAVLGAYCALDYGFYRANVAAQVNLDDGALADKTMIALGVAGLCLFIAAAAGRISGLGPLVAGLILGAAPSVWVFLDFGSFVDRLDDVPEAWDMTTFGLSFVSFAIFPGVAGTLLGAAFAGRWRRHPVTS
jgi:hypothetical protein